VKIPHIFGKPMRERLPEHGNVPHWELEIGPLVIMLDPEVIGEPPWQSPTWELDIDGVSLGRGLRKGAATKRAERYLTHLRDALNEVIP
jgi:hypothetical protein